MRLRILLCLMGLTGFLFSSVVQALGLGEITVRSQLNEPLNAEIRLLNVGDLSQAEILVFLASREDFSRAGVDRIFFLSDLEFAVFLNDPQNPYIRVTSKKLVTEPYLNFLVDLQWPTGRLVREYTILLDLPTFVQETAPEAVEAPARSSDTSNRPSSAVGPSAPSGSNSVTTQRPAAADRSVPDDSYRVERGDTLWEIAARSRPSSSVSVNQTMLAIQRINPEAFTGGNINQLQSGRVLRIPTESEISQLSFDEANREVQTQNRVWAGDTTAQQATLTSSPATRSSGNATGSAPAGRLTLGAADSGSSEARGTGSSASGSALQNDLNAAEEELDRTTRENNELKSRIADLESQIETMEQLINASNDQLRALELSTQQGEESGAELLPDSSEPIEAGSEVIGLPSETTDPSIVSENEANDVGIQTPPAVEQPIVEQPAPIVEPPPVVEAPIVEEPNAQPGLVEILKQQWQFIVAGIAGLLLVILLALRLRKPKEAVEDDSFHFEEDNDFYEEDADLGLQDHPLDDEPLESLDEESDVDDGITAETEDVIAEADIYVSLGQEDKAIELLQKEVQQNPGNVEARLGLLGIFATAQNVEAFDDQYAQLLPLGDSYAIDQAKELRKQMDGADPFNEDDYSLDADASSIGDLEELDLDNGLEELPEQDQVEPIDELDLDLDLDLDEGKVDADSENLNDIDSELDGLDFDLDEGIVDADSENLSDIDSELDDLDLDLELVESGSMSGAEDAGDALDKTLSLDSDDLGLDTDTAGLLDEIAEAADVDDEGLATELDSAIDDLDDLDLDLHISDDDNVVEFDLGDEDLDELEKSFDVSEATSADEVSLDESLDLDNGLEILDEGNEKPESVSSTDDVLEDASDLLSAESDAFDELSLDSDITEDLETLSDELLDADLEPVVTAQEDLELEPESSLDAGDLINQEDELPADMDFEALTDGEELQSDDSSEDKLSFDEPPLDLDIDGLDEEIDAMTAELDTVEPSLSSDNDSVDLESTEETPSAEKPKEPADVDISEDNDLAFLDETDEVATKLDLARAYLDMGDHEGAQDILEEVVAEGNDTQVSEAKALMKDI